MKNKLIQFVKQHKQAIAVIVTAVFLLFGVLQYWAGLSYVLKLTPIVITIITAGVILFWDINHKQRLKIVLTAMIIGLIAEVIGVNSGLLFGEYSYSNTALGFKLFGVPILVGIMWALVTISAWQLASLGGFNRWLTAVLASFIVVIFDLLLEQYATAYGLWSWQGGVIPLLNYASWFVVSFIIFILFGLVIKKDNISLYGLAAIPLMMLYFWAMLIFT